MSVPPPGSDRPADTDVRRIYARRFPDQDRRNKAAVWREVVRHGLQRWVPPTATVLDVGCGQGEFLNHVQCARRIGVDLNPDAAGALDPAVEFRAGDVRDLSFLGDRSVDVVFTSNLLEHLPSKADIEALLREVHRVLRPGGHLIALGPNIKYVPGAYWDFWDHHIPLTDQSVVEVLELLGYEVTDCHPQFLPYTTRSGLPQAPWLVRLYLWIRPAWRMFGAQFLVRARRP